MTAWQCCNKGAGTAILSLTSPVSQQVCTVFHLKTESIETGRKCNVAGAAAELVSGWCCPAAVARCCLALLGCVEQLQRDQLCHCSFEETAADQTTDPVCFHLANSQQATTRHQSMATMKHNGIGWSSRPTCLSSNGEHQLGSTTCCRCQKPAIADSSCLYPGQVPGWP
jgi:hypothetical protein